MSDDLIRRQDAIDALGEEPEVWSGNDEYAQGLNNQWYYDINALKALPSEQSELQWIPCSEKLPKKGMREVLLYSNDKISGGVYMGDRMWNVDYNDTDSSVYIVAWMPPPKLYEKKNERTKTGN